MGKDALFAALAERSRFHGADAARHRAAGEFVKAAVARAWADCADACLADARYELDDEAEPDEYDAWVDAAVGSYVP